MRESVAWVALSVALAAAIVWPRVPLKDASDRVVRVEGLRPGVVPPLTADEARLFGHAVVTQGRVDAPGGPYLLTVVDGTRDRHVVHDPQSCILGDGWRVVRRSSLRLPGGEGQVLEVERSGSRRQVAFWYTDGRRRFSSAPRAWLRASLRRLTLGASGPEPVLVLVDAPSASPRWDLLLALSPGLADL